MGIIEEHIQREQYIEEVAAYIRVSTQEQKLHGISLEAQVQKLEEYAAKHNMKIVEWYKDEGVSGRKLIKNRPELQRMIHDAQKGKFKRIIFIKLDRFFRSVAEYHECMKLITPVIWTATEEKFDLATPSGVAFVNMKLTMAQFEADQTGERIRMVNEYKVKAGQPLGGNQALPFCFCVGEPENGERHKYVAKRNEGPMNDAIAHIRVNRSVRGALLYINNKYGLNIRYAALKSALENTMLYGYYRGNPNYCDPYCTKEVFDEIQQIIKSNPRTSNTEHAYYFAGLLKCPRCGTRLGGAIQSYKKETPEGTVRWKKYAYRCNNNKVNGICDFNKVVFENTVENLMLKELDSVLAKKAAKVADVSAQVESVSKYNLSDLQAELDRLNYSFQKNRISVEMYDKRYEEIQAQIDAANAERAEIEHAPDLERVKGIISAGWQTIYADMEDEDKRAFWRTFIEEIELEYGETWKRKHIADIKFL